MHGVRGAGWREGREVHLAADEVDVLLNLGHPLSQDGEQLRHGGVGVQQHLPALTVAGVEEGKLWWLEVEVEVERRGEERRGERERERGQRLC